MRDFKIDRENKTFIFDDGEVIPIPKDKQKQVLRSKSGDKSKQEEKEQLKKFMGTENPTSLDAYSAVTKDKFFGGLFPTAKNYVSSAVKGISTGEGQEGMDYVGRILDHFYAMQEARKEHIGELKEKHPVASNLGSGTAFLGELSALGSTPAKYALPLMGAADSETSFLEPLEKSKEVGKDFITGAILDKFFGGLSKIAGHRDSQRKLKDLIKSTEEGNAAEIQRAATATEAEQARFAQDTASRETELQRLSKAQEAENKAFINESSQQVERVAKTIGQQSIEAEALGVSEFIENVVNTSPYAATKEASYVSKFLQSIFKGDKSGKISGESLKKSMKSLDEAILKNEGATKDFLIDFKKSVINGFPERLASSYVSEKWLPKIVQDATSKTDKDLIKIFNVSPITQDMILGKVGHDFTHRLSNSVNETIENVINKYKGNLHKINPASLQQEILQEIEKNPELRKLFSKMDNFFERSMSGRNFTKETIEYAYKGINDFNKLIREYPTRVAEKVASSYEKYFPDIQLQFAQKADVTQKALSKSPTSANQLPLPPPVSPAMQIAPNLSPVPVMPEPQGILERLASGLESMRGAGLGGAMQTAKENIPSAFLAKLAGLPIGKAVAGGAALATGIRGLTSPGVAGHAIRGGLNQGIRGIYQIVEEKAMRYPSYQNGILNDPVERRSLVREVEDDQEIPNTEKALIQSKINRGKPIDQRLQ